MNKNIETLLDSLSRSKFRGSFHLNDKMKEYVREKGIDKIQKDAEEIVLKRLSSSNPFNDGKQTPMKQQHPVFIAQHAKGCCCRGCLERIHKIKKGRLLTQEQVDYIVSVIICWIKKEVWK